jgi:Uncharacterized protein conserved in bacteria
MIEVSPVLMFSGNCEEAFEFYRKVFGGEFQFLYRYGDVNAEDIPEGCRNKIMHISLPLMKNVFLMGSDSAGKVRTGETVSIGLRLNSAEETECLFNALAENGSITDPLTKVFYADLYGSLVDRFGVRWTFNCNIGREPE